EIKPHYANPIPARPLPWAALHRAFSPFIPHGGEFSTEVRHQTAKPARIYGWRREKNGLVARAGYAQTRAITEWPLAASRSGRQLWLRRLPRYGGTISSFAYFGDQA